jgi:hypothetical protein
MELPPFETGVMNVTEACVLPAVAVTPVGAPGTAHCKVVVDNIAPVDVPAEFTAYARK